AAGDAGSTWTRDNPFPATLLAVRNLNGEGSAKYTSHVEIDLTGSDLTYEVGDSLGLYPTNCGELVDEVLAELGADPIAVVTPPTGDPCSLRQALIERVCLAEVTDELLEALVPRCAEPADAELLKRALDDPDAIDGWDVLDVLRAVPSAKIGFDAFLQTLGPLQPRLYSISSSPKAHPGQVHLTVGRVEWERGSRKRKGVASTMLADRLRVGETVRVFVQKSHGFTVPPDPQAPAIMVGPGTGIAPFRAFLEERAVTQAPGRNWLFFGDQRGETDFLYRDELTALRDRGVLHRLDTAFSRDQAEKIYVQNRMLEAADELYDWLRDGAYLYVCGDAKRMAVDVDRTLHAIVADRAGGEAAAKAFVQDLKKSKRYCRDVY
ncbi:sulfite reductase subunit alpha, partial [Alienimonas sp. DA493]|uniref:sulfite reductase subunit alpha n=1 Tax=Alienimonas sp. DA493 TaxID=3373605 RepID=UPI00375459C3